MKRVDGKVAVVTGGAAGIGRSACTLLAREGAAVAIADIDEANGKNLGKEISDAGNIARFWRMDTSNENQVAEVFKQIAKEFGKIDVLVNNAGILGVNKPTDEATEAEWDRLMSVNVKGVFFCTKHAIPHMRKAGGGSIINLSSIYGIIGAPDAPAYHASKGAVRLMTKTDAMFFAKDKIRVNSVHPGCIVTPLVEAMAKEYPGGRTAFLEVMSALHPIGHLGEPDDIGHAIVYLASDESKFMTGSEVVVDGGYTAR